MAMSLFALLDDISSLLDDVATMSKIAAKQTIGVLGDDLALNAEQISGNVAARELPIVWAVTKGSLMNKLFLVPFALLMNLISPKIIIYLLMIGGAYLCFEGVEKLIHSYHKRQERSNPPENKTESKIPLPPPQEIDPDKLEKQKIKGAIRTDFILSAEIIVICLGSLSESPLLTQILTLSGLALFFTFFVYGLVAVIVKIDDVGLWLMQRQDQMSKKLGGKLLVFAPFLMRALTVVGTVAMFLVGGGIIVHNLPLMHHFSMHLLLSLKWPEGAFNLMFNAVMGMSIGLLCFGVIHCLKAIQNYFKTV